MTAFEARSSANSLLDAFDMKLIILKRLLEKAEQRLFEGAWRIARQKELIVEMSSRGTDIGPYQAVLATFEVTLNLHVQDVERIKREMYGSSRR